MVPAASWETRAAPSIRNKMPDNYPDGVSTSDIPGFRQYDEELDRLYDAAKKDLGRELVEWEMDTIDRIPVRGL